MRPPPVARRTLLPLALALAAPLAAQDAVSVARRDTAARSLHAVFLPAQALASPRVDGSLDDAAWAAAQATGPFTQRQPFTGAPATERTEVRIVYDRDAIYVGVRAWDAHPDSIGRQLARRDPDGIYSDWIHIGFDSYRDRRTGFRFSLNPRGVQGDGFLFNDGDEDELWDAVWTGASQVDARGWTAEFRIPLSQLRYAPGAVGGGAARSSAPGVPALPPGAWGFNVVREIARRGEEGWWAPTPPDQPGVVSRFGTLTGMDSLGVASAMELVPYVRAQATRAPAAPGNPFVDATELRTAAGLDLRRRLPRNLTLSATVNPDFGQAEVDPAVVNLTQFEVFFPERRFFFLEGADVFRFGRTTTLNDDDPPTFFYSRRIGRAPTRRPGGADVRFVDAPAQTGILGAAKVSGKTPGGWSVGTLAALTRAEEARLLDTAGRVRETPVEPAGGYGVARLRRDFRGGNTVVGGMTTASVRDPSGEFARLLPTSSLVAGLDAEHAWDGRTWAVSGVVAGSRVAGDPAFVTRLQRAPSRQFQRPDAAHLGVDSARRTLGGHLAALSLAKTGGRHWVGSVTYEETSPGFDVNDVGFQQRADSRALSTALFHREQRQGTRGLARRLREWETGVFTTVSRNFGGDVLAVRTAATAEAELASFWSAYAFASRSAAAYDDRLLRGGPLARVPARWTLEGGVNTDSRRAVIGGLDGGVTRDGAGRAATEVGLELDVRPTSALRLRLEPGWSRQRQVDQYVADAADPTATATFGRRYVFGTIRREEVSVSTRVDWTFSPRLSLQLFAQPFAATGRYLGFASFARPRAFAFVPLAARREAGTVTVDADDAGPSPAIVFDEPDFAVRSLRGNAVVRWEYRPGSAVFVVWQQQREVARDAALGPLPSGERPRVERVFGDPGTHVLLLKVSHWLGR